MRLLLDENLDWRLRRDLLDHQVESVPLIGWAGIENGELLRKAVEAGFDVLTTMDSNMVHQQNTGKYPIAVTALRARGVSYLQTEPVLFPLGHAQNPKAFCSLWSRLNSDIPFRSRPNQSHALPR
jgi:predicted nuclease of predicted toxin-antitoxin system